MDLVGVRFLRKVAPHNAGAVAGFPAQQAADLIERGLAVAYDPDAPEPDGSAPVAALLEGSVADIVHRLTNTEDRELLVAAREAERTGEGRPTAIRAIDERQFRLRLKFLNPEAEDEGDPSPPAAVAPEPPSTTGGRRTDGPAGAASAPAPDGAAGPLAEDGAGPVLDGDIAQVARRIAAIDDPQRLHALSEQESDGASRGGVFHVIKERLRALGEGPKALRKAEGPVQPASGALRGPARGG